ncbi:hypothetical protein [Macrococcus equipercicus]|uniref:Uncharacterized protein n=1 Tax=Macrococcus equipercicus TaxID=69967 RepID=A0A9Q9BPE0_9STAP|nr:hypothetical protein [Macrococcus equipercicus]UTH13246.1 hypothetical protein KFV11_08220 [Macrococcus equipercicus]
MKYLHYLIACQEQDLEAMKTILASDAKLTIISEDGSEFKGDYHHLIHSLGDYFSTECVWDFDVLHRAERRHEELVVIKATRENVTTQKSGAYLWLLTFDTNKIDHYLKRVYVEVINPLKAE